MFWKVLLATLALAGTTVTVLPQKEVTVIDVRIGETKEITTPPSFPFESIYQKNVYTLDENGNQKDFSSVCRETPADILFTKTYSFPLNVKKQLPTNDIVTTFDEIKADRRILDATLMDDMAYLLVRENLLWVFNTKVGESKPTSVKLPTALVNLTIQTGYFVQLNSSKLLLVTQDEAFRIDGKDIVRLEGYQKFTDLQSARELFGNFFAVGGISSGIVIYNLDKDALVKVKTLDTAFFQRDAIFISDMAYNKDKDQLFVSDEKFGINIIKINKNSSAGINPVLSNYGYRKVGCSVIVYMDGNLYASCDDLFKVQYSTDQGIVDMPNPMFKVKELLVYKGLIVAVGEDLITKYYNDKQTEEAPEFDNTERLIFYGGNKYLMANYYEIQTGTFSIKYPSIVCSTSNQSLEGVVNAVIKTEAECSDAYFTKYGTKPEQASKGNASCIYSSPVQFHFWQGGKFNPDIILIGMGVLFLVAGIITTWAIFIYTKQAQLRRSLGAYTNPNVVEMKQAVAMPQYQQMSEEGAKSSTDVNMEIEINVSETKKSLQEDQGAHSID